MGHRRGTYGLLTKSKEMSQVPNVNLNCTTEIIQTILTEDYKSIVFGLNKALGVKPET